MKASIKLRDEENKPPLLRAKIPFSIFSLPFATAVAAGDPSDLSFHLLTAFPSLPSLKLSYHPNPTNPNRNRNPTNPSPFTLTLKSGAGRLGSPAAFPLHISFALSPNPANPSFSIAVKPHFGHFSLLKTAASPPPNPNSYPKENGGGVHHPTPLGPADRTPLDGLVRGGVGVRVRTAVPVGRRAGLKVRWAAKLPPAEGGGSAGFFGRLPYLTVDKISVERVEEEEEAAAAAAEVKGNAKGFGEKDFEAMKGMCFWMGREVEELWKESRAIKESVEAVRMKFLETNAASERERRKNASDGGNGGGFSVAGRRA